MVETKQFGRAIAQWKLRNGAVEVGRRTLVMGVVNLTPDSFSDGGLFLDHQAAIARSMQLLDEGADLLDLGAESTRPRSLPVSAGEEQARLLPVLEAVLEARPTALISVDTYKASTARAALAAGAQVVNDVSGFAWDSDLPSVCADAGCGVILMHTRGRPEQWAQQPQLEPHAVVAMVHAGLAASMARSAAAGLAPESIVLDPGYGFGKRGVENFALLGAQNKLLALGRPLLAGVSRKSFLGQALAPLYSGNAAPIDARETASLAALVTAILNGASLVRVHNVRAAVEAALVADAVLTQTAQHVRQ